MTYFSENMLERADYHIGRLATEHRTLMTLRTLLAKVVERRGNLTYIDRRYVPLAYEQLIFGRYAKHPLQFGVTAPVDEQLEVNHVHVDGKWYDLRCDSSMAADFTAAVAELLVVDHTPMFGDISQFDYESIPFDYAVDNVFRDGVHVDEYCYLVDSSNWKYIAAVVYKIIHGITCN